MKQRRIILLIFSLFLFSILCVGQNVSHSFGKSPIDTSLFDKWPSVGIAAITNDGKYVSYFINNQPTGGRTLVLQSIKGNWEMAFLNIDNVSFTDDSRNAVFKNEKDSLCLLTLGTSSLEYISNVSSFNLFLHDNVEWLTCQLKTSEKELIFRNLKNGNQRFFSDVGQYWLSNSGNSLVIKKKVEKENKISQALYWVPFPNGTPSLIREGDNMGNIIFDVTDSQIAFTVDNKTEKTFWYYKSNTDKAVLLANNQTFGIDKDLKLAEISAFSKNGQRLFIKLKEADFLQPKSDAVQVDVWAYTDAKLQSQQLDEVKPVFYDIFGSHGPQSYVAVLDINDHRITRLQQPNEKIRLLDDIAVITKTNGGDKTEWNWNLDSRPNFYLLSTKTGERKLLREIKYPMFSPAGKYLIGTDLIEDGRNNNLFSYNLTTGQVVNISQRLPIPNDGMDVLGSGRKYRDLQIANWLADDDGAILYDQYDIWQIDLSGKKVPVSLTNGFGRKNHIVFTLIPLFPPKAFDRNRPFIVSAFNNRNKENGFYKIMPGRKENPELLTMNPVVYYVPKINLTNCPIKARDAEVYLVCSESASQAPNYSWTTDFKTFNPLTHIYPEKTFNWLTSELLTFTTLDGKKMQGALYKPENFDPQKKYPIIINYYEKKSDRLNTYHSPAFILDEINIPWFVSNGYIVFIPDIVYTISKPGQSALNSVAGAAKYLMKFQWVDAKHIGIQGHSFGGFETNYIITHTNLFAAAMSSSGISDLISGYGSLMLGPPQFGLQYMYEVGQLRMGSTPSEEPDLYIKNSPIFQSEKVTTPLLMMNNKKDGVVSFAQGIEFFTALRRLHKKVWMLQYDNGTHSLPAGSNDAKDYTNRMTQFFDHYLKGEPAPKWMLYGIPAKDKGIDDGLELAREKDPKTGKWLTPKESSLLTEEEKKKVEALKHRKPITITLK